MTVNRKAFATARQSSADMSPELRLDSAGGISQRCSPEEARLGSAQVSDCCSAGRHTLYV